MSIPVPLAELAAAVAERGPFAFLATTGDDGRPHVTSVRVEVEGDTLRVGAGRRTSANAAARPAVALLWPADVQGGLCLLVDATALPAGDEAPAGDGSGGGLRLRPTGAILHQTVRP